MSLLRTILNDVKTRMEAIACDTRYADTAGFKHANGVYVPEDLRDRSRGTRVFVLYDSGVRVPDLDSPGGVNTEWSTVEAKLLMMVVYLQGTDALELQRVLGEDADRIMNQLGRADLYPAGLERRTAVVQSIDLQPASGGTAMVMWDITVRYSPTF